MLLHVILADDDIRRVQVENLPETVDELKTTLKVKLDLEGDIVIQFQDPEFNNELCNLTEMSELPTERPRLKVIVKEQPNIPPFAFSLDDSCSETAIGTSASSACPPSTSRSRHWPDPFVIPTFSYDIELKLKKGNVTYKIDGSLLAVNAAMKRDILDKVGCAMYKYNAYPTSKQIEDVAKALVGKYPCLREPGSSQGWYCWKFSLAFKMGNLRQKYRIAGCPELTVNQKRSADMSTGNKTMKKAKRSELNFLPDFPEGKSPDCIESERITLMQEMKKKKRDRKMIDSLMESTFALRRKELVNGEPLVSEIKERWPALFMKKQIRAEFMRIVSTDLHQSFFDGLDKYVPKLLQMYRMRTSSSDLRSLLEPLDVETSNQKRRAAALLGLPYYLKEDPCSFILVCEDTISEKDATKEVDVGILIVTEGSSKLLLAKEIVNVGVVLEEQIIQHDLEDVANAFATLMGLLYCLDIDYPKRLKYTFEVMQKVFMGIGSGSCSAKVHGLRNRLLQD
ncbi:hypothetical protein IRJ41_009305 [Triplophysa rosa]|uniref:Sterile alpha motif domain-containing protein 3 n=1 Tax=Triplophysa rosa TaxID=992332 RepID=A0A9W7W8M8_TRIRA|nr:hypothetical protein IRJ41_009305 [Triplophysa rosa]